MRKLTFFLLGVLLGQVAMYPVILKWKNTPIEYVLEIPLVNYDAVSTRTYTMKKVRNLYDKKKTDLIVNIVPLSTLRLEYGDRSGNYDPDVMGFYDYKKHAIWTIDNTDVLVHELRHVFEAGFHRSFEEIQKKGRFKVYYDF